MEAARDVLHADYDRQGAAAAAGACDTGTLPVPGTDTFELPWVEKYRPTNVRAF